MWGRSLTGYNPDTVGNIVATVSQQLSTQWEDNYPLSEWTMPALMEKDNETGNERGLRGKYKKMGCHFEVIA
jgi:hypothetical protein